MWDRNLLARAVMGSAARPGQGEHPWADDGRALQPPARPRISKKTESRLTPLAQAPPRAAQRIDPPLNLSDDERDRADLDATREPLRPARLRSEIPNGI